MRRRLFLAGGCALLLGGWLSAFLMRALPYQSDFYFIVPALLIGVGIGLLRSELTAMRTAVVVAMTAMIAIASVNQYYPGGKISVFNFLQRMETRVQEGVPVVIEVRDSDKTGVFNSERKLASLTEVRVQLFSRLPGAVRMLSFDSAGRLYASIPELGAIYQLSDHDGDGFADQPLLYHVGLDRPHGMAWIGDRLYVAETGQLLQLQDTDQDNQVDEVTVILAGLPDDGGHWTRSLVADAAGYLYLSIGSRCNACEESDQRRATVLRVDPRSKQTEAFASGLRNSVGLAFAVDGSLWASDNGRDMLGDDLPPDEINRLEAGNDYGWPYCFGKQVPDPELGNRLLCEKTTPAEVELPAHSAPLGICFGDSLQAPAVYRNSMFVALHGSWNRSVPTGYKLARIPFTNGKPGNAREFLFGWLEDNGKAWGRPVAPLVGPDGCLYLSDDRANVIYRISWKDQE